MPPAGRATIPPSEGMAIFRGRRNAVIVIFVGDREVVASIVAGNPAGLAEAYDRYAPALHAYCRSMLREPADAADAVQDTFVIAASRLRDLRDPDRLRPWLYAVARNVCLRKLRADKAAAHFAPALSAAVPESRPGDQAELAEFRALVRDAAGGLTWRDREILRLRLWEELGPDEAGAVLGVSRGYASALFNRARDQLMACVGDLLVARTGRADCATLGQILANWDGQLTILIRKRLSRHIERCDTCSGRRRRELAPALLGLSPSAAIAGAAALGHAAAHTGGAATAHAGGAAFALKAQTLAAAAGHAEPVAAGPFGGNGFPRPAHHGGSWPAHVARVRETAGRGPATAAGSAAAVALAAAVAAVIALALPGGGHPGQASGPTPGARPGGGSTAPGHGGHAPGPPGGMPTSPSRTSPSGNNPATPGGAVAVLAQASQPANPAPTSANSSSPAPGPSPAPPPASTTPPPSPPSTPPASPTTGKISVTATTVLLTPLLGGKITLTAEGGPVDWSISERASLLGSVTVSRSSGHLAAGASTTVTIGTSSLASLDTTLTVHPGGAVIRVLLGVGL